jgi:hypothetical protein
MSKSGVSVFTSSSATARRIKTAFPRGFQFSQVSPSFAELPEPSRTFQNAMDNSMLLFRN